MQSIKRIIEIPQNQSLFLWGPRMTGKSSLLRQRYPNAIYYDYLRSDTFLQHTADPSVLRSEIQSSTRAHDSPIILDEVQRVPAILNEVHAMIEDLGLHFILCGSSARKLKRGGANLLSGRAWRMLMHPLVSQEIKERDLARIFKHGLMPKMWLEADPTRSHQAYLENYLEEEVFAEALVRNIPAFSRFFEALSYSHGSIINFSKIAADVGVGSKTIKSYFEILSDTLVGHLITPYTRAQKRSVLTRMPKFYLFDVGLANYMMQRDASIPGTSAFGMSLEHFIFMELLAYKSYHQKRYQIRYWRTKHGVEVDFILGQAEVAIEVKSGSTIRVADLRGLRSFREDNPQVKQIAVASINARQSIDDITAYPIWDFLDELWEGRVI